MNTFLNSHNIYKKYAYINDTIIDNNIEKKNIIIGIDGNLFCYKYSHSCDNMLIGFYNQILNFLSHGYIPLYIFDGGTVEEKELTNFNRNKKKCISRSKLDSLETYLSNENEDIDDLLYDELFQYKKKLEKDTIKISNTEIKKVIELLDLLNIPYIFANNEAEYLAVLLNNYNIIDLFLSDDTDPIASGINKLIKFNNNMVIYFDINECYQKLNIDKKQLCDISILLGTDYMKFNHKLKPKEIYKLIYDNYSIENIIEFVNDGSIYSTDEFLIIINKIRHIYFNSPDNEKNYILNKECVYDSNILIEFWDEFIDIFKAYDSDKVNMYKVNMYKVNIINYIKNRKINIKNIVKFFKQNVNDITNDELDITITSLMTVMTIIHL